MKKTSLLIAGVVAGALISSGVHAEKPLRLATNTPYVPMEYTQPDGTLVGFDIDLGNAVCAKLERECTWSEQEFDGLIPGLMAHRFDIVMAAMTATEKRAKQVAFSQPYIAIASAFFAPVDSPISKIDKDSLKGKHIGVQRGTVQDEYATDMFKDIASVDRYQHAGDVTVDLEVGRLDVAFFDQITGQTDVIDAHPGEYHQIGKSITEPKAYFGDGFAAAFNKKDSKLVKAFDQALEELKADGTYAKIYEKYFHQDPPEDH